MKQAILIMIGLFAALCIQAADITSITNAFNAGNASALSGSMDNEVDVAVPGASKKGNAAEAVAILTTFFTNNKPTGFTVVHHADKRKMVFWLENYLHPPVNIVSMSPTGLMETRRLYNQ